MLLVVSCRVLVAVCCVLLFRVCCLLCCCCVLTVPLLFVDGCSLRVAFWRFVVVAVVSLFVVCCLWIVVDALCWCYFV